MAQQQVVADTLETWREAERLLDELPPLSPDHETVAKMCFEFRETYQRLARASNATSDVLDASRERIAEARELLRQVRERRVL